MVRKDGAEIRKQRIQEVARNVNSQLYKTPKLSLSQTLAVLAYETGLTKEKLMEYLGIIQETGQFEVDSKQDLIFRIVEEPTVEQILGAARENFNPNLNGAKPLKREPQ